VNRTSTGPRVALATCAAFPHLAPDDQLLVEALAARGARPQAVVWDDEAVEWDRFEACVVRSVWDYHFKHERFLAWARRAGAAMPLWNGPELLAWNSEKSYLRELAERGVPTIPTEWIPRGTGAQLAELLASRGWEEAVVKPTVDLGALNLRRIHGGGNGIDQIVLEGLLARHEVMVQPYLAAIEKRGETSLIYVAGELSHTVRKRPKQGDFRVQPTWGGSVAAVEPSPAELEIAARALAALDEKPLYARVDLVAGDDGAPLLIELELIDPRLFFAEHQTTASALADAALARFRLP
jgi:glutathione synthase/RimK-type ligase-like ATP-grasp enzyme